MHSPKFNILCVDDDLGFRRYLSSSLDENYTIRYYSLGFECLAKCQDWNFDVILIDATLPDMVSEHLVDKIKSLPMANKIPIIIVSYKNSDRERKRFKSCGCDHFLSKVASPYEIKAIFTEVGSRAA